MCRLCTAPNTADSYVPVFRFADDRKESLIVSGVEVVGVMSREDEGRPLRECWGIGAARPYFGRTLVGYHVQYVVISSIVWKILDQGRAGLAQFTLKTIRNNIEQHAHSKC